jgi:hypothetical protein
MAKSFDLSSIFQTVYQNLSKEKDSLNEADSYNHDHGDHMVQIFGLIQDAVSKKKEDPVSDQLQFASKILKEEANSGSSKLYTQGLQAAANNLSGSELTPQNVIVLVKSLLGADKEPDTQPENGGGGLIGALISGLTGADKKGSKENNGLDVDDLLRAGLAFYQSKQDGENNTQAAMEALIAASPMGESPHRSQSGTIVASSIMQMAQSFFKK